MKLLSLYQKKTPAMKTGAINVKFLLVFNDFSDG